MGLILYLLTPWFSIAWDKGNRDIPRRSSAKRSSRSKVESGISLSMPPLNAVCVEVGKCYSLGGAPRSSM